MFWLRYAVCFCGNHSEINGVASELKNLENKMWMIQLSICFCILGWRRTGAQGENWAQGPKSRAIWQAEVSWPQWVWYVDYLKLAPLFWLFFPPNSELISSSSPGHGTTSSSHPIEPSKPPPGPRMPDGTRGFTMGRGRTPISNQS